MPRLFHTTLRLALLAAVLSWMPACVRAPLKDAGHALRLTSAPPLSDDLPLEPLIKAVETEIEFLEKNPGHDVFIFGERQIIKREYLSGLRRFAELARTLGAGPEFFEAVRREFDFYEVYGDKSWGQAFITSYYEPIVPGSKRRTDRFSRPLYRQPDDLLVLDLVPFNAEKYALDRKWRGRVDGKKFVPYYTREEIDVGGALKNRKLELVWVDPLDAFLVQIQGSATVDLGKGKSLRVGFADKNGRDYEPLGKFLRDAIPKEQMSLQMIEKVMRSLPGERQQELMNKNPSYVFFKEAEGAPVTFLGVAPTDGRTAAVDQRFFPKGALAFLVTVKPKWASPEEFLPAQWERLARFVLDQDTGGAITGGGRLDLYWGTGDEAKRNAGVMKQDGELYYLAPKASTR